MTEKSRNSSSLRVGATGHASLTVEDAQTAIRMGSGRAPVLATPAMIALMEAAAIDCVEDHLPAGQETLGVHLDVDHIAPTPVGARISATAELTAVDGRRLSFRVEAAEGDTVIGRGTHTRVAVDSARFRAKLARP